MARPFIYQFFFAVGFLTTLLCCLTNLAGLDVVADDLERHQRRETAS